MGNTRVHKRRNSQIVKRKATEVKIEEKLKKRFKKLLVPSLHVDTVADVKMDMIGKVYLRKRVQT